MAASSLSLICRLAQHRQFISIDMAAKAGHADHKLRELVTGLNNAATVYEEYRYLGILNGNGAGGRRTLEYGDRHGHAQGVMSHAY